MSLLELKDETMSLFSRISSRLQARRRRSKDRRQRMRNAKPPISVEILEERTLLAGLVMEESVFDVTQFAKNIEEQVPVDAFGLNGVVGYSYAIIDGDPDNPITDAGNDSFKGYSRMPWDGALGAFPIETGPNVPQEIASPSKVLTAAAVMHLLQEQVLADPETYPDFEAGMQQDLDQNIIGFLPATWGPGGAGAWTANFNTITIRELLTHTSGLLPANNNTGGTVTGPAGANVYNYGGLQQIAEGAWLMSTLRRTRLGQPTTGPTISPGSA
jgi:CubicO group peptidase (beta-lactamase class C family)